MRSGERGLRYNPHVHKLFWLSCLFAAWGFSQTASYGIFTNSDDVGAPSIKGSADFDAITGQYKITGSGCRPYYPRGQVVPIGVTSQTRIDVANRLMAPVGQPY